ncbi:unnamed protein product, partial [Rotaria sp. Silwood1]
DDDDRSCRNATHELVQKALILIARTNVTY